MKKIYCILYVMVMIMISGCAQPVTKSLTQSIRIESHHYYNHSYDDNGSIIAELKYATTY